MTLGKSPNTSEPPFSYLLKMGRTSPIKENTCEEEVKCENAWHTAWPIVGAEKLLLPLLQQMLIEPLLRPGTVCLALPCIPSAREMAQQIYSICELPVTFFPKW